MRPLSEVVEVEEDEDGDEEREKVSSREGLGGLEIGIKFLEQLDSMDSEDLKPVSFFEVFNQNVYVTHTLSTHLLDDQLVFKSYI
ncbi:hypothetical protein BpHYR1_008434 [Brachionus plicatilis]|uniref:Uncharacterized protein n=1 Tax=Brachionus plicatilis TaxID=10195 RepID=A0A3M7SC14_BRAPC|nr:hypothetical protein BpHYR1_008434 [Brachionus plicatilis]